MTQHHLGLQLYTVRDETAQDFPLTLRRVADMGYAGVEFAGYGGIPSKEMASLLAEYGLRAFGSHVGLQALENDLEKEINYALDIGCSYLILPWIDMDARKPENINQLAIRLDQIGLTCQQRGITFAYHNHDFEFQQVDGTYLLDILLNNTDPNYVKLELDSYWAAFAGVDPKVYLEKHAGRVPFVHLKDMTPERTFAEVGSGTLDIKGYIQAARDAGTHYFIVENDQPKIPSLESAVRSYEFLAPYFP